MSSSLDAVVLPLFVPADRPDRFAKAFAAGADAVILDLEDAVSPGAKTAARSALGAARDAVAAAGCPVLVRVNAPGTPWHGDDLAAAAALPLAGIVLPKAETADAVAAAARAAGVPVVALIESARGVAGAREVAGAAARLLFGSIDLAADLGCAEERDSLLFARSEVVLASRLAGRPAPIDGVTPGYRDPAPIEDDARYAARLGFGGKLLIHPAQIAPARAGFAPTEAEVAWARRVLAAAEDGRAVAVDGAMVDAPVRMRAERILARAPA
ncbi:HpcH/HpaI aldolase/citrate lyase family protein [Lichenibacterium dinghuense]|uniref:HpcH/HpaI aldolase/citrate lyase family protein n=1 Tax=Lichenibacterium dinghuense TaxID=2895977 RepID=UPI001F293B3F|nr:CoA ester lyase [Lichenibacterium sp. 6Y81]